jgi:hypothetical protein
MSTITKQGSFGTCQACGTRKNKAAMVAHLKTCLSAGAGSKASTGIVLLRAQAPGFPPFWLYIAAKSDTRLKDVDRFLRRIWLECCGHMSEFSGPSHRKISMNMTVGEATGLFAGKLNYVYDFGSSTELQVSSSTILESPMKTSVQLAARNEAPTWLCNSCGKPATTVCAQCVYEGRGFCCAAHASSHECGDEMLLPVVNSPRMGVCGYTGEAY